MLMLKGIYAVSIMLSVAYKPIMLTVIMLSVAYKPTMLTVIMLSVDMLTVVMLNVVMLSVMAPLGRNKLVCLAQKTSTLVFSFIKIIFPGPGIEPRTLLCFIPFNHTLPLSHSNSQGKNVRKVGYFPRLFPKYLTRILINFPLSNTLAYHANA
jgi:hypothetical protein